MRLVMSLGVAVWALLSATPPAFAQAESVSAALTLTEADAIRRLMAEDPRLRSLQAVVDEVRATQAERSYWPNLSLTYAREHVARSTDVFWLARQELPVSGRLAYLRTAGGLATEVAEADVRFQALQLQTEVRHAFATLLVAQEREAILRRALDDLQALIVLLRAREDAGEGSTYDRMRGERARADLEADLAAAAIARTAARGTLAVYLGPGVTPDRLVAAGPLAPPAPPRPVEALVAQAQAARGDYRAAELAVGRYQAERQAAARLVVPTPTLSGGLKRSGTEGLARSGYEFSFDLAVPLFNRGQAAVALATAQSARADAQRIWLRTRIETEVRTAHAVLLVEQNRAAQYGRAAVDVSEPLAKIGRVAYEEGELGILELLDAEQQALDARLRAIDLTVAARRAAIDLDRIVGQEIRP